MLGSNLILFVGTMGISMIVGLFTTSGPDITIFEFLPITQITTIALAILGIIYSKKAKYGIKKAYMVVLIIGLITAIGIFIPLLPPRIIDIGDGSTYPAPAVTLVTSLIYIDPFLLINGGLIGLLTVEFVTEEERDTLKAEKETIRKKRAAIRKERDKVKHEKKAAKKKKRKKGVVEVKEEDIEELEAIKREREALKKEREALKKEKEELEREKEVVEED